MLLVLNFQNETFSFFLVISFALIYYGQNIRTGKQSYVWGSNYCFFKFL